MLEVLLVSVISSLGLGLSLFFGFLYIKSKKSSNVILGILLILLALRILKSVFYNFIELPIYIKNIGLAANLGVGPLLYLYGLSLVTTFKNVRSSFYLHFIPSALYLIFSAVIPNAKDSTVWYYLYLLIILQSFCYIGCSLYLYIKPLSTLDPNSRSWYLQLIMALSGIWLVYTFIFIGVVPVYAAGPISYSILIVILAYLAFNKRDTLSLQGIEKYRGSKVSFNQGMRYLEKLDTLMKEQKLYLRPDLNLEHLATQIGLSPREVSQIINRHSHKNFASFINSYRIEEAKRKLEVSGEKVKIIGVALDSGFKNISTFNVAFKSFTQQTPSEYRARFR